MLTAIGGGRISGTRGGAGGVTRRGGRGANLGIGGDGTMDATSGFGASSIIGGMGMGSSGIGAGALATGSIIAIAILAGPSPKALQPARSAETPMTLACRAQVAPQIV